MVRKVIIFGLFIASVIVVPLLGCAPAVVIVRPPEPRFEVYGSAPYPEAVWIPGYWKHGRGEWVWVQGYWTKPPRPQAIWIPGYWEPKKEGWVWVSGHWEYY